MRIKVVIISKVRVHLRALAAWTCGRGMPIHTLGRRYYSSLMNATMSLHLRKTTAAMAAFMLAGVAKASPGEPGITVCSRMLEACLPQPEAAARKYRIELLNRGHVDTENAYAAGKITYDLRPVEAGSGRAVAAAACIVSDDGAVVAMLIEPRASGGPSLAGRC